jgi:hypothetical protein
VEIVEVFLGRLGGPLLTWQHSFAGPSNRPTQNHLTFQPFFIYNLPEGWHLRSTASRCLPA